MQSSNRTWFETFVTWLNPYLLVEGTKWEADWAQQERTNFTSLVRVVAPLIAAAYVAHYFFYDVPMKLEPLEDWFALRFTVAGVWIACTIYYLTPLPRNQKLFRFPAILATLVMCFSQGIATVWYGQSTWIFGFIIVITSTALLRMSVFHTLGYLFVAIGLLVSQYVQTDLTTPDILTGTIVTVILAIVLRSSAAADLRYYLLNKENIDAQKQIAELNSDLAQRVQAFIPRVIAQRINTAMEQEKKSVVEASIDVLQPRKVDVACLYSDIRGYTKGTNQDEGLDAFISGSVIPEVKACSEAIETYGGVPRKIGDLVFGYYDSPSYVRNITNCLLSAFQLARLNQDMNETYSSVQIRRYILVSCGEAIVGNIGGMDSSIEITALGSPVNFLSRLDEVTKLDAIANQLQNGDIVVTEECLTEVPLLGHLEHFEILLDEASLSIRDYPSVRRVYRIPPTEFNLTLLRDGSVDPQGPHERQIPVSHRPASA